jgi:hypothetical protein
VIGLGAGRGAFVWQSLILDQLSNRLRYHRLHTPHLLSCMCPIGLGRPRTSMPQRRTVLHLPALLQVALNGKLQVRQWVTTPEATLTYNILKHSS